MELLLKTIVGLAMAAAFGIIVYRMLLLIAIRILTVYINYTEKKE